MSLKLVFTCKMFLCSLIFGITTLCFAQQPAFPTAEGFGRYARGGRDGDVYHVTNLNDDGIGSLRYGIEEMNGPRTIVFDVSGIIHLGDRLKIEDPYLTIAGQTAPGDGITLWGHAFEIEDSEVIVRYIRCRFGDVSGEQKDAVSINRGSNIILDHVTASWSVDETLSCQSEDVDSLTVQWCMITESLRYSVHDKGAHGYGGIIGALRQSFHHNLYAHHSSRSPKVSWRRHCEVDFRNNVIYNWGYNNCYDGASSYLNWANNYYKPGPATESDVRHRIFKLEDSDKGEYKYYQTSLYAEGNYVHGYPSVTADNWNGGIDFDDGATEALNRALTPFNFPHITEQPVEKMYSLVVESAGASNTRDEIDERIANEVLTGTANYGRAGIIDSQDDVGGVPVHYTFDAPLDSDGDGMPDYWESQFQSILSNSPDNNKDTDKDGYTNLEEYFNSSNPINDGKPVVYLQTLNSRAAESKPGVIIFRRHGDISDSLTVPFSIDGTAITGIDFQSLPDSIVFPAGENKVDLKIQPIDDSNNETVKSVHITLSTESQDYYVGCPATNYIAINAANSSQIEQKENASPGDYRLANYPNPFNSSTTLFFSLDKAGFVRLSIYNIHGQRIETLIDKFMDLGPHEIQWNADQLASGVYFFKLETNQHMEAGKMLLVR